MEIDLNAIFLENITIIMWMFYKLPNKVNSNHKPTFFSGNNNPFSIKPGTVAWVKIFERTFNFLGFKSLCLFQSGPKIVVQKWAIDATRGVSR